MIQHGKKVRVYGASNTNHADYWKDQRINTVFPCVTWTARWPDLIGTINPTPANSALFWEYDFEDITNSDVIMVYALDKAPLRGALIEVGYALSVDKYVLLIGPEEHPSFNTWQYHYLVTRVSNEHEASEWLFLLTQRTTSHV